MEAYINFIEYYLPEKRLTNEMINAEHPEWSADKISAKTGIYSRPITNIEEYASDLAIQSTRQIFNNTALKPKNIDFLLYCTQSPDYFLPTTACILQEKLNLPQTAGALDFNLGCSGYVYGLYMAKSMVTCGQINNILLITAETYSKYIHPRDKGNKTLFGDAAASIIISDQPYGDFRAKIGKFAFYTDGKGFDRLIVKNGGIRFRYEKGADQYDEDGSFVKNDGYLFMDGKAIFEFTNFIVPPLLDRALENNNLRKDQVDLFVFHQANAFMMHTVRKRCQIPEEKFFIHIKDCGNTVSSTIPIALKEAFKQGRIACGMRIVLAGFGVGLSAAIGVIEIC